MKHTSNHWLLERGTREGNRLIFSRPWIPAVDTDIRKTFQNIRDRKQVEQYERDIAAQEFANNI